jgi:hypothetical protein
LYLHEPVSTRGFLFTAALTLGLGSICLVLASVLDSGLLAAGGALFILAALVAKEAWLSGGRREWLLSPLTTS